MLVQGAWKVRPERKGGLAELKLPTPPKRSQCCAYIPPWVRADAALKENEGLVPVVFIVAI